MAGGSYGFNADDEISRRLENARNDLNRSGSPKKSMADFAQEVESGARLRFAVDPPRRRTPQTATRTRRQASSPSRSPVRDAFDTADQQRDGVLTREEFEKAFESGNLARDDFRPDYAAKGDAPMNWDSPVGSLKDPSSPSRSPGESSREAKRLADARKKVVEDAIRMVEREEEAIEEGQRQAEYRRANGGRSPPGSPPRTTVRPAENQAERETRIRNEAHSRAWEEVNSVSGILTWRKYLDPFEPWNTFLLVLFYLAYMVATDR